MTLHSIQDKITYVLFFEATEEGKSYNNHNICGYAKEYETEEQCFATMHYISSFGKVIIANKANWIGQGNILSPIWGEMFTHPTTNNYLSRVSAAVIDTDSFKIYQKSIKFTLVQNNAGTPLDNLFTEISITPQPTEPGGVAAIYSINKDAFMRDEKGVVNLNTSGPVAHDRIEYADGDDDIPYENLDDYLRQNHEEEDDED